MDGGGFAAPILSKELSDSEKLDQLDALIPPNAFKIDSLSTATAQQLRQLKDSFAVTGAMQEIRRARFIKRDPRAS